MKTKHLVGQLVTLKSSAGLIERVVARDLGEILLVCRAEEYAMARVEAREPAMIGFLRTDIIESDEK